MNLLITDKVPEKELMLLNRVELKEAKNLETNIDNLTLYELHKVLASRRFEYGVVLLVDTDGIEHIPKIKERCSNFKVHIMEDCTPRMLKVLCDLYPEKASDLRGAYMKGERRKFDGL